MVTFRCSCGKTLQAKDELAGQMVKCPNPSCGRIVTVPQTQTKLEAPKVQPPPPPIPAVSAPPLIPAVSTPPLIPAVPTPSPIWRAGPPPQQAGLMVGIISGAAMLLTLFIPWGSYLKRTMMSWDIIDIYPGEFAVFLIGCWILGLAAVITTPLLRRLPRGIVQTSLGFVALILIIVLMAGFAKGSRGGYGSRSREFDIFETSGLAIFTYLALLVMLVGTHLRFRFPDRLLAKLLAGISGGILAVLELVSTISTILSLELLNQAPGWFVLLVIVSLLSGLACMAAGILCVLNLFPSNRDERMLSKTTLGLIYGTLGALLLCVILVSALASEEFGMILSSMNIMALFVGSAFLFGGGGLTLLTDLLGRSRHIQAQEPLIKPVPEPTDLESKLKTLKNLHEEGLITEEEFQNKRQHILSQF